MSDYTILFKPSVEKDLRSLPREMVEPILSRAFQLAEDPLPQKVKKLTGTERTYRIRAREYRIVYEIDTTKKVITILYIRHRRDAYRSF